VNYDEVFFLGFLSLGGGVGMPMGIRRSGEHTSRHRRTVGFWEFIVAVCGGAAELGRSACGGRVMSRTDVRGKILAGAAACVYLVACALPVTERVNLGHGHPMGSHPGLVALLLGWISYESPLHFVAWMSNFPWLAALVGRLARGPTRWVRCCTVAGLACAVPAFLPGWPDKTFGGYPARHWWFASYVLLAAACWVRPAGSATRDAPGAAPGTPFGDEGA